MNLQHYETFNIKPSYGIVGLLRQTDEKGDLTLFRNNTVSATDYFFVTDEPDNPVFLFKIPIHVNTLSDHEFKVAKDIEELGTYLPHFNRILELKRDMRCCCDHKHSCNPFSPKRRCPGVVRRDVLVIEYIPSKVTLLDYLHKARFCEASYSLIHQVAIALFVAQQEKMFTHYDLHLDNILIRKCLKRTFFLYRFLYKGVTLNRLVYTRGHFPVIFDYGFAYSKGCENSNYNNSLFFTSKGYTPFMFDEINDFKTLIIRLAYIKDCPQEFKNLARNLFLESKHLTVKFYKDTGWIKSKIPSISKLVFKKLIKSIITSQQRDYENNFVYKELEGIIDLFSTLIIFPIEKDQKQDESELDNAVNVFLKEWNKIDVLFVRRDDKLNIIKRILGAINCIIYSQVEDNSKTDELVRVFKLEMFKIFDDFGKFVNVENFNYETFLMAVLTISNFIEKIASREIERYKKMFNMNLMDNWFLFTELENSVYSDAPQTFEDDDKIVVFDCLEKSTTSFDLKDCDDVIAALNSLTTLTKQITLINNLQLVDFQ